MTTDIILVLFAIIYYLFSVFLFATYISDVNKKYTILQILGMTIETMILSPIVIPIICGVEIGEYIRKN